MWRGGLRCGLSVTAPFVWRCLNSRTITPFPHPPHRTGHADFPHPLSDKTSRLHPRLAAPKLGQADESEVPVEVREGIRPAPAAPDLVLVAQPPAQPRSGVVVERTVGPVGRPYPRVVRPAAQGARFNCCTNSVVLAPVHPTIAAPRTPRYPRTLVHPRPARPDWSGTGHRQREEYPRGRACRTGHRSDSWAQPSLSRVMPSVVSEPFSGHCQRKLA